MRAELCENPLFRENLRLAKKNLSFSLNKGGSDFKEHPGHSCRGGRPSEAMEKEGWNVCHITVKHLLYFQKIARKLMCIIKYIYSVLL